MHILNIFVIFSLCSVALAENSCIFEHATKGVVNLTSIGFRNGQPRFRDISDSLSSYYTYSFNPCFSFTESSCRNVAVCQMTSDRSFSFSLAKQNASKWSIDSSNTPVLTYTSGGKTVSISMICSPTNQDTLDVISENPANHYSMRLYSPCACWNGCKTPTPTPEPTRPPTITTTAEPQPTTTDAIYYDSCTYHSPQYGTIDLSSIGSTTGTPTFKDYTSTYMYNYVWSYNPCYKFSEFACQNVAGCIIDKTNNMSYTIALQDNAYWINVNTNTSRVPAIVYPSTTSNQRLIVQLICDKSTSSNPQLSVLGQTAIGEYTMQLISHCACWDGCVHRHPDPQPFNWQLWAITGGIGAAVFLFFCMMITCLFCSKPKRSYPAIINDEKTPFIKGSKHYYA